MNYQEKQDFDKKLIATPNEEFDKMVCEKWPELFRQRHLPKTQTCMYWGLDIGNGWFPIIWDLCKKLDFIRRSFGIIVEFAQIKSKFGSLRTYVDYSAPKDSDKIKNEEEAFLIFDIVDDIIGKYQRESAYTCSETGEWYLKKITINGWTHDVCPEVLKKRYADNPEALKEIEEQEVVFAK